MDFHKKIGGSDVGLSSYQISALQYYYEDTTDGGFGDVS